MSIITEIRSVAQHVVVVDQGEFFWNPTEEHVWFVGPDSGFDIADDQTGADPMTLLRSRFLAIDGVSEVTIADEYFPEDEDTGEIPEGWEEVSYELSLAAQQGVQAYIDEMFPPDKLQGSHQSSNGHHGHHAVKTVAQPTKEQRDAQELLFANILLALEHLGQSGASDVKSFLVDNGPHKDVRYGMVKQSLKALEHNKLVRSHKEDDRTKYDIRTRGRQRLEKIREYKRRGGK